MDEIHVPIYNGVNIILDILRVGGNDRAVVMVVGILELVALIRNAGVEDVPDALIDQPLHMAVSQFGRVALGLAGDGFDSQLIYLLGRRRRKNHAKAQARKEGKPERVVLIHIQDPWDSNLAEFCFLFAERLVIKVTFKLIFKQVGKPVLCLLLAKSPLAAIAGDELATAAEMVDSQTAVVGAAPALGHGGGVL